MTLKYRGLKKIVGILPAKGLMAGTAEMLLQWNLLCALCKEFQKITLRIVRDILIIYFAYCSNNNVYINTQLEVK